jgi:DNA repair protein RecO (recombination protein O)
MANYKARGIILRRDNFGEADRLVTLYTNRFGKITLLAKGTRRPTAKLTGTVNLFNEIDLVAAESRSIDILVEAQIVVLRDKLSSDLTKAKAAYWVCELVDKLVQDNEAHIELYNLIHNILNAITQRNSDLVLSYFIFQCLNELGYRPELKHCAVCGKALTPPAKMYFSPVAGGIVSTCCIGTSGRPINPDTIKAMRFLDAPFGQAIKLKLPANIQKELHTHLKDFSEYIGQKKIRSEEL